MSVLQHHITNCLDYFYYEFHCPNKHYLYHHNYCTDGSSNVAVVVMVETSYSAVIGTAKRTVDTNPIQTSSGVVSSRETSHNFWNNTDFETSTHLISTLAGNNIASSSSKKENSKETAVNKCGVDHVAERETCYQSS